MLRRFFHGVKCPGYRDLNKRQIRSHPGLNLCQMPGGCPEGMGTLGFDSYISIIPAIKTDHAGIYLELQDTLENCKGPGFWKFNTSLLSNEGYISLMEQKIPEWINENVSIEDKRVRWDFLKYQIRKESVMFPKG